MGNYKYPVDLIEPLRAAWPEFRLHEGGDKPELPPDDYLLALLETLYHASFTLEEERRTRLTAVVCDPADASDPLTFAKPREFTIHELMRLAPVASDRVRVGLTHANQGPVPQIWGLCSDAYMQLMISIRAPGILEIIRNDMPLLALRQGKLDEGSGGAAFQTLINFLSQANDAVCQA